MLYQKFKKTFFLGIILTLLIIGPTIAPISNASFKNTKDFLESKANHILSQLTLEEKVGQLFIIGGNWNYPSSIYLVNRYHFGNAYLGRSDVDQKTPEDVLTLTQKIQTAAIKYNRIPMLIFADQEGGSVNRLQNGFTTFPSQEEMAKKPLEEIKDAAQVTAKQLKSVGIHVNLAPVIDVDNVPTSHIAKYHRSFSSDPQKVTDYAKIYIQAFQRENIIACVKHFPNDGDLTQDPHYNLPVNLKTKEELLASSLVPYRELIAADLLQMLMVSHVAVPALEPDPTIPVSLSKNAIQGFLRKELGFQGLVITDEMNMKAIGQGNIPTRAQIQKAAIQAVEAGVDMFLFAGYEQNHIAAYEALVKAFKENRLSITKLNDTVGKILILKYQYISQW